MFSITERLGILLGRNRALVPLRSEYVQEFGARASPAMSLASSAVPANMTTRDLALAGYNT